MNIHEYQAKEILRRYGVPVPRGIPVFSAEEAATAANAIISETGSETLVVKAQIHAGGRGKGRFQEHPELGGVKVVQGARAVRELAQRMLGSTLVTHQTGPEGRVVRRLLVEQGVDIARELYVGAVLDRASQRVAVMASAEGGMEIEEVAARSPEAIVTEVVDPAVGGLAAYQARKLAFKLGLSGEAHAHAVQFMVAVARAFEGEHASLLEINPLVVTGSGQVMALDAKVNLDDSAAYAHPEWSDMQDTGEEEASEIEARKYSLSYVKLDGTIGCMVNGAGLAMATMDIIKQFGGEPANFLDVGGAADKARVAAAFKIILSDPNVRGIFVNIFGGIVHCDNVAQGVVDAVKETGLAVPLVVRLEGTNVEAGKKILAASGLKLEPADDMADGARKIVTLAGGAA